MDSTQPIQPAQQETSWKDLNMKEKACVVVSTLFLTTTVAFSIFDKLNAFFGSEGGEGGNITDAACIGNLTEGF